jgi:hypothetical protein
MSEAVRDGECSRCNGCFNAAAMLPLVEKDVMLDTGQEPWISIEREMEGEREFPFLRKTFVKGRICGSY